MSPPENAERSRPAALFSVRRLTRIFSKKDGGANRVLSDVDFDLCPGEFAVIRGPSGSGKTTFLNLLGLLDRPDSGHVMLEGQYTGALSEGERSGLRARRLGFVFQSFHLLGDRTALENVLLRFRYQPEFSRREARQRSMDALDRVGLAHLAAQPARLLSGGEQQRVAIARAVASHPAGLLADEPTGNLDERSGDRVLNILLDLQRNGIAVLVATHDPSLCAAGAVWDCRDGAIRPAETPP